MRHTKIGSIPSMKGPIGLVAMALLMLFAMPGVKGALQLDNIYFDPAIIAAGDEVDIVIQYHDESLPFDDEKVGSKEYTFDVELVPDDRLAKEYVLMQDPAGDDVRGRIFGGEYYNKRFRVKVANDAPPADYQFKLVGQWYKDGEPVSSKRYVRFTMPVKKEGIILGVTSYETIPEEVRPGDDDVAINAMIENSGEKAAKSVAVTLATPQELTASFTDNNRRWIGRLDPGESRELTFYVDVDETATSGVVDMGYEMTYRDLDENSYSKSQNVSFRIKPRPYLEVLSSQGSGPAGGAGDLRIRVKNTGEESAESVDVRLLKKNSQPFSLDIRSDYIGELEPGDSGVAVIPLEIDSNAQQKQHSFQVFIRAKGDSDKGDDTIYTFTRRATFDVEGEAPNWPLRAGLGIAPLVVLGLLVKMYTGKGGREETRRRRKR